MILLLHLSFAVIILSMTLHWKTVTDWFKDSISVIKVSNKRGMPVTSRKNPSVICSAEIKQDVKFVLQYKNVFYVNAVCRTAHQPLSDFNVSVVQLEGVHHH